MRFLKEPIEKRDELRCDRLPSIDDVGVVDFALGNPGGVVGDAGDRAALQTEFGGDARFLNGGHTDEIAPERAECAHLRRRFIIRAEQPGVDPAANGRSRFRSGVTQPLVHS